MKNTIDNKKITLFDSFFLKVISIAFVLELVSLLTFIFPSIKNLFFLLILSLAIFFTIKNLENGIYIMLLELILGGQGYLFSYTLNNELKLSFRLAFFLILFVFSFIKILRKKDYSFLKNRIFYIFAGFIFFIFISLITAILQERPLSNIFFDINGYLFFGLFLLSISQKNLNVQNLKNNKIIQIILSATTWLSIKTILILVIFSYGLSNIGNNLLYKWIRDTQVGEITKMSISDYRIFFQSHIYLLISFFISLTILFLYKNKTKKDFIILCTVLFLNFSGLIISQSRSLWVSGLLSLLFTLILFIFTFKISWKKIIIFILLLPTIFYTNNIFIKIILHKDFSFTKNRLSMEENNISSISSRKAQIVPLLQQIKNHPLFGSGFAQKITYTNEDPRIKNENNPSGLYSTYSFELGYLSTILKMGVLGFAIYLIFIMYLCQKLFLLSKEKPWLIAIVISLLSIVFTDAFTPYLNHPLGIGFILISILLYENNKTKTKPNDVCLQ